MSRSSPTAKRRRIARELRRLRAEKGTTVTDVARAVGLSSSALSRIETADVSAQPPVVGALLRYYGVDETDVTALVDLAKQARKRGWWAPYNDVLPEWFEVYVGLESEAVKVRKYEPQLVPGLLQTADYARAIIRAAHPNATDVEVDRRERDEPLAMWAVVDEAVLRRTVGDAKVMRGQLERVIEAANMPGNDIQVLPFAVGEHGSMGSGFSVLSFADHRDHSVVYIETRAGSLYLEEPDEVVTYETLFDHLRATAIGAKQSIEMMSDAIRSL